MLLLDCRNMRNPAIVELFPRLFPHTEAPVQTVCFVLHNNMEPPDVRLVNLPTNFCVCLVDDIKYFAQLRRRCLVSSYAFITCMELAHVASKCGYCMISRDPAVTFSLPLYVSF